jgi:predicted nucleic acid-binding Zn ribbon protein
MSFRGDNSRSLKEWLQVFSQSPQLRARLYQTRVEKMWLELMGPVIDQYTRRIKLDGQTLLIFVESSPLKAELTVMRESIRSQVNERLGEEYIKEVKIF